jgi:hypothetical protein
VPDRRRLPRGTPPQVRALVAAGERVLAWAFVRGGPTVVASTVALYVPDPADPDVHVRLPYEQVASATWDEPVLDVVTVGPRRHRFVLEIDDPGLVPETVRDRVTASIVVSEHVPLAGSAGARITARRPPVGDAGVTWNVVFDAGLDASDPGLRAAADAAIERLRASTGL